MRQYDDRMYLEHVIECVETIERFLKGNPQSFLLDEVIREACLRRLQIMAESTQRLSERCKTAMPQIDWAGPAGFRNILVHDYLGDINLERVAGFLQIELKQLEQAVSERLKEENHE